MIELPSDFNYERFFTRLYRDVKEMWDLHQKPLPLRGLTGRLRRGSRDLPVLEYVMENQRKLGYHIAMSRNAGRYIFLADAWDAMGEVDHNKFYRMGRRFYLSAPPRPSDLRRAEIALAHKLMAEDPDKVGLIKAEVKQIIRESEEKEKANMTEPVAPALPRFF